MLINPALRLKGLWLSIGIALVCLVFYLSLTSSPPGGPDIPFVDKWGHLLAYATLMGWFSQLLLQPKARLLLVVLLVAMGIGLEFLQQLGGVRMFEIADMVANSLGVVLAWLLTLPTNARQLLAKLEQRLQR